ncbi:MAG: redoxin family protein [Chloroflexi bacterium]|nr:redoxin family protein [Chloroflexota bacterium]
MIVLLFAFIAGLLTILAPCTLPVVPLVLGSSVGASRRRIPGLFLGFGATFIAVTVIFASTLAAAGLTTDRLRLGAAILLGVVGLTLAWRPLERWVERRLSPVQALASSRLSARTIGGEGLGSGMIVGAAIGLVWAPCVGPIMAAVIAAATATGPSLHAVAIAVAYVAGALVPLIAIARWGRRLTERVDRRATDRLRRAFGVAMVMVSVVMLTGLDVPLQSRLTAGFPGLSTTLFALEQNPAVQEDLTVLRPSAATGTDTVPLVNLGSAPELAGISDWINSDPLTIAGLRGKVVLVHFWTFGCINCINVQPYVKTWFDRYADQGFVVVGVHTPELSFEREIGNVRDAVAKADVRFPVAFDPSYATWNAYRNSYWPAFYFVDKTGQIRHVHYGEGDYDGSESVIRELLAEPPPA